MLADPRGNRGTQPTQPVNKPQTTPAGGNGSTQPISLGSAAPAIDPRNPANAPALPPIPPQSFVPPVSSFPQPGSVPNQNNQGPNGYNPTTAPYGYDKSAPGVAEQHWDKNQGKWMDTPGVDWANSQLGQFDDPWFGEQTNQALAGNIAQPGAGQQYWNGIQGSANTMTGAESTIAGGYQNPGNAQSAFDKMGGALPGSLQPQFDAYYDRMKQKAMSDVNTQSAARGVYGSSSALNGSIGASLDIEAQRAKAATDFSLADSANQRDWLTNYGTLGRNADLSGSDAFSQNINAAKYGLDKTKTYGDLAFQAENLDFDKKKTAGEMAFDVDDHRKDRLQTGIDTALAGDQLMTNRLTGSANEAGNAQTARENRINGLFGQLSDFTDDVQDFMQTNADTIINADGSINEQELEAQIARMADERGYSDQQREVLARDAEAAAKVIAAAKTPGGKTS